MALTVDEGLVLERYSSYIRKSGRSPSVAMLQILTGLGRVRVEHAVSYLMKEQMLPSVSSMLDRSVSTIHIWFDGKKIMTSPISVPSWEFTGAEVVSGDTIVSSVDTPFHLKKAGDSVTFEYTIRLPALIIGTWWKRSMKCRCHCDALDIHFTDSTTKSIPLNIVIPFDNQKHFVKVVIVRGHNDNS